MHKSSTASQPRWGYLSRSRFLTFKKMVLFWLYNDHFVDHASSVKMAGYWPRSVLTREAHAQHELS